MDTAENLARMLLLYLHKSVRVSPYKLNSVASWNPGHAVVQNNDRSYCYIRAKEPKEGKLCKRVILSKIGSSAIKASFKYV